MLVRISSEREEEGKVYYKDNDGKFHEYNDEVIKNEVATLYHGKTLVKCVPSKAEEKILKIQI